MIGLFLLYVVLGAFAGILAGLLGIGGGLVIVPMLTFAFMWQGIPYEHILHLALGTSLTTIIFTSISSFLAHHKRGAVRWDVFWRITPGIIVGTFLGAWVASLLPTNVLKAFFGVFLYYVSFQMITGKKPNPSRQIPGNAGMFAVGNGIGIVSALVGIGGGTLSVPFLVWCNVVMQTAIGTASAIGLPIALSGSLGFLLNGLGAEGLPEWSIGYIYLPALIGIVSMSVVTAPFGAKLAHTLPVPTLKKVFAVLLFVVGTRMLWSVFAG
ncbi:sulfite exporter TauE/SafE family protein [Oceanidesulfovibrio indonesiensis]|uniref:Probable membrane transporter protein n=1 Tax=Oceanidesulfovibrio indonesiensis TaxID=54767 RepID=A0A7M3MFZ8_9BACT|nr:sulfite exporter TauE/SafE family protein [Oceanidesulfovibrio indonesiensis]TVM18244.1 sulfite exporter TauE/SafE family protein [Oceanidesulfovibrio indonesiensis]